MSLSFVPSRRELIAWVLATVLAVGLVVGAGADAGADVPGPKTQTVFIATGANFPDALGAAAVAGASLAPVLLVTRDAIPEETLTELQRLQPDSIVIVGGTSVVSDAVVDELEALGFAPTVTRIAGANRYDTAAELSAANFPTTGFYPRAAHAESTNVSDSTSNNVRLSTSITAPADGTLIINAGADFYRQLPVSGSDVVTCWIGIDTTSILALEPGSKRVIDVEDGTGDNAAEQDCITQIAVDVAAGSHTVYFLAAIGSGTLIDQGALTVLWVPFDGNGAVPQIPA